MVTINESKFGFKLVGISPETDQLEFECSLEDFITENQNGFFLSIEDMFQAIINAKCDKTIHAISDKILVKKVNINDKRGVR
tara:strand:- start:1838 stop:2083 length:246 start_codon:yes stop_codon:yes gene_type:complete